MAASSRISVHDALPGVFQDDSGPNSDGNVMTSEDEESETSEREHSEISFDDDSDEDEYADEVPHVPAPPWYSTFSPSSETKAGLQLYNNLAQSVDSHTYLPDLAHSSLADPSTPVQPTAQPARGVARDGTVWTDQMPPKAKVEPSIIAPGPINVDKDASILQLFELFMPAEMLQMILDNTNIFGQTMQGQGRQWSNIAMMELRSVIGLLIYLGLTKSGNEPTRFFWRPGIFARATCQATMSGDRFQDILRMMRFDDRTTRRQRKMVDKFAPIREVFEIFADSCRRYYSPGECLTVDEQLVGFRGKCPFSQYVPQTSTRYGLKFWTCVDTNSHYVCNIEPYIGKNIRRDSALGESVVQDMMQPYYGTGRNVTCGSNFTSKDLAEYLLTQQLTIVGNIKCNRPEVPEAMHKANTLGRAVKSSHFMFTDNMTLVSYVQKKNKNIAVLSTKHHDTKIRQTSGKPEMVHYYNSTKAAVETIGQMCSLYNCSRKTKQWPLMVFYNIINIAAINAFVLWLELNPDWSQGESTSLRHAFLGELITALIEPQIKKRADKPSGLKQCTTLAITYLGYEVKYKRHLRRRDTDPATQGNCHLCPRGKRRRRTTRVCEECLRYSCIQHSESKRIALTCCAACIMKK